MLFPQSITKGVILARRNCGEQQMLDRLSNMNGQPNGTISTGTHEQSYDNSVIADHVDV